MRLKKKRFNPKIIYNLVHDSWGKQLNLFPARDSMVSRTVYQLNTEVLPF